jgi:hypothetical protein
MLSGKGMEAMIDPQVYAQTKTVELERLAENANKGGAERTWLTRFFRAVTRLLDRWKHAKGS